MPLIEQPKTWIWSSHYSQALYSTQSLWQVIRLMIKKTTHVMMTWGSRPSQAWQEWVLLPTIYSLLINDPLTHPMPDFWYIGIILEHKLQVLDLCHYIFSYLYLILIQSLNLHIIFHQWLSYHDIMQFHFQI